MSDRLGHLYPQPVAGRRLVLALPVPKFPPAAERRNESSTRAFYGERLLGEFRLAASDDRIAVIDKLFPHSRYDCMLLASNDDPVRTAASDLSSTSLGVIFDLAYRFVEYVSDPETTARHGLDGAEIHFSFNFDRDTVDRDNAMFYDKRFHLHLNCWPRRDLRAPGNTTFAQISDPLIRRRVIDPLAALGGLILRDAAGPDIHGYRLDASVPDDPSLPVGLRVPLGKWSAVRDPQFPSLLQRLHTTAETAYRDIRTCFVGTADPGPAWTRPRLLPRAAIDANLVAVGWLSDAAREGLRGLADALGDVDPEQLARFRQDPAGAARQLTLNGLDYSVGLFSRRAGLPGARQIDADDVTLMFQPRLFGDVGGAGLPPLMNAAAVRLDRKSGQEMTVEEMADRAEFRRMFLETAVPAVSGDGLVRYVPNARRG